MSQVVFVSQTVQLVRFVSTRLQTKMYHNGFSLDCTIPRERGGGGRIPSLCYAMYIFWLFFVELRICNFCLRTDQTDRSESSTVVSRNVPCVFLHLGAILPPQRPRHDALLSHFVVNKLMRVRTGVCVSGWRH